MAAVIRDIFFFSGILLWLESLIQIWVTGKYLYKDASGAISQTFVFYLVFAVVAASHYVANGEGGWLLGLKRLCRNIMFVLSVFVIGVSGLLGFAVAQLISQEIPSRDLEELTGSILAHFTLIIMTVVAHYISKPKS